MILKDTPSALLIYNIQQNAGIRTREVLTAAWCESNSPRFYHFCVRQFMQLSLFLTHSGFFAFSFYILASPIMDGMLTNGKRTQRSEKEAEKERLTWTAVPRNCKIRDYQNRLWCVNLWSSQHPWHYKYYSAKNSKKAKDGEKKDFLTLQRRLFL